MSEEWKAITGTDGWYEVSNQGRVRSWKGKGFGWVGKRLPEPKILQQGATRGGYLAVKLYVDGSKRCRGVHRLVLEEFIGPCPVGMEGCHKNGDPADNRLSNLRWDTPLSNAEDKRKHGTMPRGEHMYWAKLTPEKVREARQLYIPGHPEFGNKPLARRYGVSHGAMKNALKGNTWKHVEKDTD